MPYRADLKKMNAENSSPVPYGAENLASTDVKALEASLLKQLAASHLPAPHSIDLKPAAAPTSAAKGAHFDIREGRILGNDNPEALKTITDALDRNYPAEASCEKPALTINEFNAFAALHETAHYVAELRAKRSAPSLDDLTYAKALGVAETPQRNLSARILKREDSGIIGESLTYPTTRFQARERIADVATCLYALSNYTDQASVQRLMTNIADVRSADSIRDATHFTSSSVELAGQAFKAAPRRNLSIVDATHWAAQIVQNDPAYNVDGAKKKDELSVQILSNAVLTEGAAALDGIPKTNEKTLRLLGDVSEKLVKSTTSRNTFCQINLP